MTGRATCLVALLFVANACGSDEPAASDPITVFAAASLTEAFTQIAAEYEDRHGIEVRLSFGPSDGLATQIQEGAPADVFASASPKWMDTVADDPGVTDRADFARNVLVVITPADDPAGIDDVEDLSSPGIKLVLAAEGVPAGDYARELLANAGIADAALANVVSNEDDVKGVVQKVALGEADAGIVYRTDVTSADRLGCRGRGDRRVRSTSSPSTRSRWSQARRTARRASSSPTSSDRGRRCSWKPASSNREAPTSGRGGRPRRSSARRSYFCPSRGSSNEHRGIASASYSRRRSPSKGCASPSSCLRGRPSSR